MAFTNIVNTCENDNLHFFGPPCKQVFKNYFLKGKVFKIRALLHLKQ